MILDRPRRRFPDALPPPLSGNLIHHLHCQYYQRYKREQCQCAFRPAPIVARHQESSLGGRSNSARFRLEVRKPSRSRLDPNAPLCISEPVEILAALPDTLETPPVRL